MIRKRRSNYLAQIENNSISIFFSGETAFKSEDQFFDFHVNRNFYYLTNLEEPGMIFVEIKSKINRSLLFINENVPIKSLWNGRVLEKEEVANISKINIDNIFYLKDFNILMNNIIEKNIYGEIKYIYADLNNYNTLDTPSVRYCKELNKKYLFLNFKNNHNILSLLRLTKDEYEIENIKKAIEITNKALNNVLNNLKPNIYEYQIEAYYDFVLKSNNVEPSFKTIVAGGKNATILHYEKNNSIVKENELVLMDLGVFYNNYASDITRTYPVSGKFTARQKEIYNIVLEANKESIKRIKPGMSFNEFNQIGKSILIDGLKKINKIQKDEEISNYYYHSLGHSLGLDVHDVGGRNGFFQEGMVITVEPGLYIEDENIGIRIEDDILITRNGCINLSESIIKEIDEIENYLDKR